MPKVQTKAFPEWRNIEPQNGKLLKHRKNVRIQATVPSSLAGQTVRDKLHPRPAFFSGPKNKAQPVEPHPQQPAKNQSTNAEPVQPPKKPNQPKLVHPSPRRYQSFPPALLATPPSQMTGVHKPLPDLPPLDGPPAPFWDACRLRVGTAFAEATKGQANEECATPSSTQERYGDSPVTAGHVTLCSREFASQRVARPNVPQRTSSMRSLRMANRGYDRGEIIDRDVLRGLHIAASAACNEQIDAFIREQTGLHIRRFLADLMPLENLGDEPLWEVKAKRTRRRQAELRLAKRRARLSRQLRERDMCGLDGVDAVACART
ncbi:hypothetical protein CEP54_014657 [Fusarium duplospermum]|uniref:Uncharacterized protein n=1 Tax=Fusarium duplospermum TaxID=1325734 RepID=A0A428NUL4_9HYPO|nr:hypothetical protein CEP54_014657 [Fusarium duplospermum]